MQSPGPPRKGQKEPASTSASLILLIQSQAVSLQGLMALKAGRHAEPGSPTSPHSCSGCGSHAASCQSSGPSLRLFSL